MERTEQMYTIQKQMDFGKIKVRAETRFWKKDTLDIFDQMLAAFIDMICCRRQQLGPVCFHEKSCVPTAISPGVVVAVAEEAWRAGRLHRGAQHLEGFQQQELLPVPLQRRTDHYQEEEVSGPRVGYERLIPSICKMIFL